jgi:beta-lactamase class A
VIATDALHDVESPITFATGDPGHITIENLEIASPAGCRWMRDLLALQQHRDRIARDLPQGVAFAGKSGSLEGYVHDSGVVSGPGGRVTMAVLTSGVADSYAMDAFIGAFARTVIDAAGIAGAALPS